MNEGLLCVQSECKTECAAIHPLPNKHLGVLVVELEFRCLPGGLVLDRNRSLGPFPRGGIEAFELEGVRVVVFGPVESGPVANVFGIVEWTK